GFRRLADPVAMARLLRLWKRCRRVSVPRDRRTLGWLGKLLAGTGSHAEVLAGRCHAELRQALRFGAFLPMAANMATALGLLGAVVALAGNNNAADPRAVLAFGMLTTVAGLLIAIPATVVDALLGGRGGRLADQVEEVLAVLEQILEHGADEDGVGADLPPRRPAG